MTYFRRHILQNNSDPKPEKVIKEKKKYSFKKKPTGELPIMLEIWNERGPYSQHNKEYLGEFDVCFMAHVLPKGQNKYPKFKLNKENVVILSFEQHTLWDHHKKDIQNLPEWKWLFELELSLKQQYSKLL